MKKIYSLLLTILLLTVYAVPVYADSDVNTLNATATTKSVTVSGTANDIAAIAAVMIEVLKDDESLAYYSLAVSSSNSFSGTISGLTLTEGSTYTVRAANYDGGDWKTISVNVPVSDVTNTKSDTYVTPKTGIDDSNYSLNRIISLTSLAVLACIAIKKNKH